MKNALLFIVIMASALAWSCNTGGEDETASSEQNFNNAKGIYYGEAKSMQADSVVLTFEAGSFNADGDPTGEAKRLTVILLVPEMPEDEIYLDDGEYRVESRDGALPFFIPGASNINDPTAWPPTGTYLASWANANTNSVSVMLFTGGSINMVYSGESDEYTITAVLTDELNNTFTTSYIGKLDLEIPVIPSESLNNMTAMYYGDGDSRTPQRWLFDLFNDDAATGGYTGLFLDIHANRVFSDEANTLQEGEYRIGSDGATGTYLPGSGEDGVYSGSYFYVMDKDQNVTDGTYITGGTFSITRSESGTYTLNANLGGRNILSGAEESKAVKFMDNPIYFDMSNPQSPENTSYVKNISWKVLPNPK